MENHFSEAVVGLLRTYLGVESSLPSKCLEISSQNICEARARLCSTDPPLLARAKIDVDPITIVQLVRAPVKPLYLELIPRDEQYEMVPVRYTPVQKAEMDSLTISQRDGFVVVPNMKILTAMNKNQQDLNKILDQESSNIRFVDKLDIPYTKSNHGLRTLLLSYKFK